MRSFRLGSKVFMVEPAGELKYILRGPGGATYLLVPVKGERESFIPMTLRNAGNRPLSGLVIRRTPAGWMAQIRLKRLARGEQPRRKRR